MAAAPQLDTIISDITGNNWEQAITQLRVRYGSITDISKEDEKLLRGAIRSTINPTNTTASIVSRTSYLWNKHIRDNLAGGGVKVSKGNAQVSQTFYGDVTQNFYLSFVAQKETHEAEDGPAVQKTLEPMEQPDLLAAEKAAHETTKQQLADALNSAQKAVEPVEPEDETLLEFTMRVTEHITDPEELSQFYYRLREACGF